MKTTTHELPTSMVVIPRYKVTDNPYNRHWYSELIGQVHQEPKAHVKYTVIGRKISKNQS